MYLKSAPIKGILLMLFAALVLTFTKSADACPTPLPRDLLFLVDSSNTMDRNRFYGEMLDFLVQIFTALPGSTRGGVITFGGEVKLRVPIRQYTTTEWTSRVEQIRSDPASCCACCTPLAEAFREARLSILRSDAENPPEANRVRIVVVITDGAVWQHAGNKPGFWTWPKKASAAKYRFQIVPQQAHALKNMYPDEPVRIMVIGVPSKTGLVFKNRDYFTNSVPNSIQCYKRGKDNACVRAGSPPFPIVSQPLDKNIFVPENWNITDMTNSILPDLCEILVTDSPTSPTITPRPTKLPTNAPTKKQTKSPTASSAPTVRGVTRSPTKLTKSPTAVTKSPTGTTKSPTGVTKSPTGVTKSPTGVTKSPTGVTKSPTGVTKSPTGVTKSPTGVTKSPTGAAGTTKTPTISIGEDTTSPTSQTVTSSPVSSPPSKAPTTTPTVRPTTARPTRPTMLPTASPSEVEVFNGLDIYIYLDRSKSMIWRADICRNAPGGNPNADDAHACWELFLKFVETLVNNATHLSYNGHPEFGWQGSWQNKTRGIRAWIYGFACADEQNTPIVDRIGEKISDAASFAQAMEAAKSIQVGGGTCPGAALERSLGMMLANELIERPYKVAVMLTDGVFYDDGRPAQAAKGLEYLGVLSYAVGISIAKKGDNMGLTPKEMRIQRSQLKAFVNGKKNRLLNFGEEGLHLLDQIAGNIVKALPNDVEESLPRLLEKPYWCGWWSPGRCENTNPETFDSSKFCKWVPNNRKNPGGAGKCKDQDFCKWKTQELCKFDKYCIWKNNKCKFLKNTSSPTTA